MSTPSKQQHIVVGVDGSARSADALSWALRQAVLTGSDVEVVACWQRPAMAGGFAPAVYVDFDLAVPTGDAARAVIADAVAAHPEATGVVIDLRVVEGYPTRVLLEAATDADLLVVGSRGHGELSGLLLGSVGLHCASHAPCPVLIVHERAAEHGR